MRVRAAGLCLVAAACSQARPKPVPPPVVDAAPVQLRLDFTRAFGGRSSSSMFDARVIDAALMRRVMVEPGLFADAEGHRAVEPWTRHRLLEALGRRGTLVIAPPLPSAVEPRAPCPVGGCFAPPPSAVLRNVRFVSGKDDLRVRVDRVDDATVAFALWQDRAPPSLCGPEYRLKLGYVELQAQVTRVQDGALAAHVAEVVMLEPPAKPVLDAPVPDPAADAAAFCRVVGQLFERDEDFARSDERYENAAASALQAALDPLYPPPK